MNAQVDLIRVPLQQLQLSPLNARKTGGTDIDGLAASIVAHGLLQNLTVTQTDANTYEVVAGGRRLAALQQLDREGRLAAGFEVPVYVINDDDTALEASTAENTLREAMHPADQFVAFKGMVDAGKPVVDVAAHFGVTERVVKQRLKLANVDPQLVQIYRDNGMDLEQLQALALTDDHKAQCNAWFKPTDNYARSAYHLRDALTKSEISARSALVQFVGLDAYEAAGGTVRRDLFSARDDAWIQDKPLLDKLVLDKLHVVAEAERAAGWSWVELHLSLDYQKRAEYPQLNQMQSEEFLAPELQARLDVVDKRLVEIDEIDADGLASPQEEALRDEAEALEEEREKIVAQTQERWPAEAMQKAGVLVFLDNNHVEVERGRLQPGQKVDKQTGAVAGTPKAAKADKPKKASLSVDMEHRLDLHRAAALRVHIAGDPRAALQLLLVQMLTRLLTTSQADSVFALSPSNEHTGTKGLIDSKFGDVGTSPARKALDELVQGWKKAGLPAKASELYPWLDKRTDTERQQLLALAVALTFNTNGGQRGRALAEQLGIDMTKTWAPTADTYLSVVPKALLAEAVTEVAGKAEGLAILALKKDAAIAQTAKKLAGTGWLPKSLRGSRYALKKPVAAKKPAKKVAAKKATKATVKKAAKPATKAT